MKTLNNRVIVKVAKRVENEISIGGKTLILDSVFRHLWNTVQIAEVVQPAQNDILVAGDIVYVHHFVSEKEQQMPLSGDNYSWVEYSQIFCVLVGNSFMPLNNWLFVTPVTYGEAGLIKSSFGLALTMHSENDHVDRIGVASELSQTAIDSGLSNGDKILFGKNCEYAIVINGILYYRMEIRDVICTLDTFDNLKIL